jgi:hypothetical protein
MNSYVTSTVGTAGGLKSGSLKMFCPEIGIGTNLDRWLAHLPVTSGDSGIPYSRSGIW